MYFSEIVGSLHGIWDRGSFAAINPSDRKRCVDINNTKAKFIVFLSQYSHYVLTCTWDQTQDLCSSRQVCYLLGLSGSLNNLFEWKILVKLVVLTINSNHLSYL